MGPQVTRPHDSLRFSLERLGAWLPTGGRALTQDA